MVECTPGRPYSGYANDLLRVERNMRLRRKRLLSQMAPDEICPSVSNYPLMGAENPVLNKKRTENKLVVALNRFSGGKKKLGVPARRWMRSRITDTNMSYPERCRHLAELPFGYDAYLGKKRKF